MDELSPRDKINAGLLEGNLRHMVDRVDGFKKAKDAQKAAGKPVIITKETRRQEAEAEELEKFMDFCGCFGEYDLWHSRYFKEAGFLGAWKPYKHDFFKNDDGSTDIKTLNVSLFWPIKVLQGMYAGMQSRIILER